MSRPCKCRCFNYEHLPHYVGTIAAEVNKYVIYSECLICNDCYKFEEMDNLEFLEWVDGQRA